MQTASEMALILGIHNQRYAAWEEPKFDYMVRHRDVSAVVDHIEPLLDAFTSYDGGETSQRLSKI